jgi:hypothetical protein
LDSGRIRTNAARLVRTRIAAIIMPSAANHAVAADGTLGVLPGQGGIVLGIKLGDRAGDHLGDHVEPGISLGYPEALANQAIQTLSCVGNPVEIVDGPASGARGIVYGKHGAVLAALSQLVLAVIGPGQRVAIEACGSGLVIEDFPDITCLSLSPALADNWLQDIARDRLVVPVVTELPPEAAAAGFGMPTYRFNMDLHSDQPPMAAMCRDLAFGDLVAVRDQDHRFGRRFRKGWIAVGVICHGRTIAGGHGFGFATLLTGPAACMELRLSAEANVAGLLGVLGEL